MNIKIKDKNGVVLKTKDKYCKEDIIVTVDENVIPTITVEDDVLKISNKDASVSNAGVLKL